jgi:hypothetical protein
VASDAEALAPVEGKSMNETIKDAMVEAIARGSAEAASTALLGWLSGQLVRRSFRCVVT